MGECTPFEGYFADNQATLQALSENVLRRLYDSVGLIVIMHHRGIVEVPNHKIVRASVWIEQEIAMATLMQQVLRRPLHVALFKQPGVALEGIRQQLQLNAHEFKNSNEVISRLREILPDWTEALYKSDEEIQKIVDSVDMSISLAFSMNSDMTVEFENHSAVDAEVKSILLRSKESRLCKPAVPPAGSQWIVPARRFVSIKFVASDNIVLRLASMHQQSPPVGQLPRIFNAKVTVEVQCTILGIDKPFAEPTNVQVDYRSGTINRL